MKSNVARGRWVESLARGPRGRFTIGALSVLLFLALWQAVGATSPSRAALISYPSEIWAAFFTLLRSGDLAGNLQVTLVELAEGFAPAVLFGVLLGLGFAFSRRFRWLVEPLFIIMYVSPYVAFVPALTVWFGVGEKSKAIIVFISAIVPIAINTKTGVSEVSPQWIRALRAFGASPSQVLTKAILPGALPSMMTGLRLAIGRAVVAVIAGEMYVSVKGIGQLVQTYSLSGRTPLILVLVGLISAFGLACVTLVRAIEFRLSPWRAGG